MLAGVEIQPVSMFVLDKADQACVCLFKAWPVDTLYRMVVTAWHSMTQHDTAWHSMGRHSLAWHSISQYDTVRGTMPQHDTAQHSVAQHGTG